MILTKVIFYLNFFLNSNYASWNKQSKLEYKAFTKSEIVNFSLTSGHSNRIVCLSGSNQYIEAFIWWKEKKMKNDISVHNLYWMIYYVITDMGLISINNIDIHPRPAGFHHSYCPGQQGFTIHIVKSGLVWFYGINATFNNISVISWRSVLLVEESGGPGENHWPAVSHWQTWSHNVVHLALGGSWTHISGDGHWLHK